ncbi:MAG TPA: hypothetical protein VK062_06590 [Burkholderiaceae bacterium]|nr:hypothetical protein [Burkholderiaceae bacterium]
MNKTDSVAFLSPLRRAAAGVVLASLSCKASPALAMLDLDGLEMDQLSVRELMRLDTEQALALARRSMPDSRPAGAPQRAVRSMAGEPRLTAIYGTGRQLMAEVRVDQDIYLYRSGQALPVGVAPGADVLMLQKISASCVGLRNERTTHHLCLRPAQWAGQ